MIAHLFIETWGLFFYDYAVFSISGSVWPGLIVSRGARGACLLFMPSLKPPAPGRYTLVLAVHDVQQ
jgi:hypothetical protein